MRGVNLGRRANVDWACWCGTFRGDSTTQEVATVELEAGNEALPRDVSTAWIVCAESPLAQGLTAIFAVSPHNPRFR